MARVDAPSKVNDYAPPRAARYVAGMIIAATFAAAVMGRAWDVGTFHIPDSPVVQSRMLKIINTRDFTATVTDATTGATVAIAKLTPETGFIWGAVNGLSYGRKLVGAGPELPYELTRRADGRLVLTDTATGQKVFLNAFGSGNLAAFAKLLEHREAAK